MVTVLILMGTWRNWYTRMLEVHVPQGLEVQILSCPPTLQPWHDRISGRSHLAPIANHGLLICRPAILSCPPPLMPTTFDVKFF